MRRKSRVSALTLLPISEEFVRMTICTVSPYFMVAMAHRFRHIALFRRLHMRAMLSLLGLAVPVFANAPFLSQFLPYLRLDALQDLVRSDATLVRPSSSRPVKLFSFAR